MLEDFGEKIFKYAMWTSGLAVFTCGIICAYTPYVQSQELKLESDRISEKIELKRKEIAKLNDYQRRFRIDPDFVEKIARENNRVYPGELVFVFEE